MKINEVFYDNWTWAERGWASKVDKDHFSEQNNTPVDYSIERIEILSFCVSKLFIEILFHNDFKSLSTLFARVNPKVVDPMGVPKYNELCSRRNMMDFV